MLRDAPASMRIRTTSACPFSDADIRAVHENCMYVIAHHAYTSVVLIFLCVCVYNRGLHNIMYTIQLYMFGLLVSSFSLLTCFL